MGIGATRQGGNIRAELAWVPPPSVAMNLAGAVIHVAALPGRRTLPATAAVRICCSVQSEHQNHCRNRENFHGFSSREKFRIARIGRGDNLAVHEQMIEQHKDAKEVAV